MKPAISVHNLSKRYRLGVAATKDNNLTENLRYHAKNAWDKIHRLVHPKKELHHDESFWALKDISFEVKPGEVVGIIGRNGAGKSTLLKVLSQIVEPTSGHAIVRGRMGSLLEVGTGFHPELTGRENVYLNGAILGMSREEINKKFDEIVAFAEVEKFLDTPVKRYSSGMYVRLAFSVAAHLEPEILLVDEVLAVGDATFQRKCIGIMKQLASSGRTIIFVSHNMELIPRFCHRAVLLEKGTVSQVGIASQVTQNYLKQLTNETRFSDLRNLKHAGTGHARFVRAKLIDGNGNEASSILSGDDLTIRMEVEANTALPNVAMALVIRNTFGSRVITSWTQETGFQPNILGGMQTFECCFRNVSLRPGHTVQIDLWMADTQVIDCVENALVVDVVGDARHEHISTNQDQGIVLFENVWRTISKT